MDKEAADHLNHMHQRVIALEGLIVDINKRIDDIENFCLKISQVLNLQIEINEYLKDKLVKKT